MRNNQSEQNLTTGQHQIWWQIFLPDRGAWFFLYLLSGMLFLRPELLLYDGGSCRHILNGVLILQNHQIPSSNYTSSIYPNIESVTRSWLSDFISGWFYQQTGLNGVVFICSLVITVGLTWSYQMGRARGLGPASGLIMLVLVMATVGMHWSARSHLYSYIPFLATYYFVFMSTDTSWRRPVWLLVCMIFWANLHGSFMIGPIMIGTKVAFNVFDLVVKKNSSVAAQLKGDIFAAVAILLGSFVNPRTFSFYSHVAGYLSNPEIVHKTDEWKAFDIFAGIGSLAFLLLLGVTIWLVLKSRTVPSKAELVFFIFMALAGFNSMRLIPYCALIAMPFLGPAWSKLSKSQEVADSAETVNSRDEKKPEEQHPDKQNPDEKTLDEKSSGKKQSKLAKLIAFEKRAQEQEKSSLKVALISTALSVLMGVLMMTLPFAKIKDFDAERLPVNAVDFMTAHNIDGLGFNYDNWGGYIYFKRRQFGQKVFIDDWADFLPVQFIEDYLTVLEARDGWQAKFAKYPFQWVMTPNEAQLAQILSRDPNWKVAFKDKVAVLLVRNKPIKGSETPPQTEERSTK